MVEMAQVGVLIPDSTPPARIGDLCAKVEAWGFNELWVSGDYFLMLVL
jgi:hypothetical protein|tara:strand:- start:282 stop:425 length:144 start_codon:yes stop_codon:yes gene_type:complete